MSISLNLLTQGFNALTIESTEEVLQLLFCFEQPIAAKIYKIGNDNIMKPFLYRNISIPSPTFKKYVDIWLGGNSIGECKDSDFFNKLILSNAKSL